MEEDPRKPQTLAMAPVLIFAAVLLAVFGAALVTAFDTAPVVVSATDTAPKSRLVDPDTCMYRRAIIAT